MTLGERMKRLLESNATDLRARAERKRQASIAKTCEDAIAMLLDDTGALGALPPGIKKLIRGDLDGIVRTLEAERDKAEAASNQD